jgi:glutamine amidotransferase
VRSWFAYISPTEPCLLEDVIVSSKHSLTNQVHEHYLPGLVAHHPRDISKDHLIVARNVIYNIDGVGLVWYTSSNADFERGDTGESGDGTQKQGLRPSMYKSVQPPANDLNYRSICANTETRVLMAHIRAASGTPIVPVNNHPFIFGRHSFMHNGAVTDFSTLKLELCQKMSKAAYLNMKGGTDSEHMAALYVSYLTNFGDETSFEQEYSTEQMGTAMTAMIMTILELQATMLGTNAKPNSLNLCATDGVKMIACRFRNHATQEPPSL